MEIFRKRYAEVRKAENARNDLLDDLLQALDDIQKTIDSNSFVLVLVDGDSLQFLNHFVRKGQDGGDDAAKLLRKEVFEYLRYDENFKRDHKIVIRIYSNLRGLSKTYVEKGILSNTAAFGEFVLGFNKAHPLNDFVDAGNHKEAADTKLKETLKLYISNVHCKQIIFGASSDNAYASFLNSYVDIDVPARIRLLKGPPFSFESQNVLHKFQWTEFKDVFRDKLLANDLQEPVQPSSEGPMVTSTFAKANPPSLLPWRISDKSERRRCIKEDSPLTSGSRPVSSNAGSANPINHTGISSESKKEFNIEPVVHGRLEDCEVVDALVLATRENLERTPKALDFGFVKSHVQQKYGLQPNFWGNSEHDRWYTRSKNVIKEEWILETNNPPPKNATWMLRFFSGDQAPSAVIQSAPWRTQPDVDLGRSKARGASTPSQATQLPEAPPTIAAPTKPRADRHSDPLLMDQVLRNAAGQRIDLPTDLKPDTQVINSLRKRGRRLCNLYYLGTCPNRNCEYDHSARLTDEELEALLFLSRSQPCSFGPTCDNPNCTKGHMCPGGRYCTHGDRCRFPDQHNIDTMPVQETYQQESNTQISEDWGKPNQIEELDLIDWRTDGQSQHPDVRW